ncbi:MAG: type II secretion system protein GspC [Desulfatitalea sp.]
MSYVNTLNLQRFTTLINLGLLTLGAYFSVGLFYQAVGMYVKTLQPAPATAEAEGSEPSASTMPVSHYNPVLERDLFKIGKAAPAPANVPAVDLDALAKTQLNLKLWGTVSGDAEQAYAVIEDLQKHEQNLYRVGDTIKNATVKIVMREKVVLTVEGRDEILTMEEMSAGGASPTMVAKGRSPRTPQPMPQPPAEGEESQSITLQRSMVEESFSDMNKLMTEIAITPNMEDGQANGLSLNRISPNSIFRRMGLRNGDVLLGVNGQPIQSTEDAMRLYEGLKSSENIQLQVKRRGQERTIDYNLK